jgi:hypothetical protein
MDTDLVLDIHSKEYKKFDFYFKRTCFRTMTLYFKTAFKPYFELCRLKKKKTQIDESLAQFVNDEMPKLLGGMSATEQDTFCDLLKMLMFCHRHQKKDF